MKSNLKSQLAINHNICNNNSMLDSRLECPNCKKLLAKGFIKSGSIGLKCPKCKEQVVVKSYGVVLERKEFKHRDFAIA